MMERIKNFLFINTGTKQTITKNTFWLFLSEGVSRLLKMVLVIYAARLLGTEGWGIFSYALSLGSLLMIFSDIGLSGLITREIVQKKEGFQTFASTALLLKLIILVLSTAAVLVIGPLASHIPEARSLLPLIALTLFFDAIRDLVLIINTAFEKMERDMIVKTVMGVLTVGIGIFLLQMQPTPQSVVIAYAVGSGAGCTAAIWAVGNDMRYVFEKIDQKLLLVVLQTALPFAAISLINNVMANTDIYLLGIWKNAAEIGLYTSVQRIQQFVIAIPVIIATAIFPLLSRLATKNDGQFSAVLGKTTALMFMIGLPISVGGIALSADIVQLLFGVAFSNAVPVLQLLFVMLLVAFPLVLFSNSIFAYNGQKKIAIAYSIGMISNALLNIMLIPKFGALGSAAATLLSTLFITCIIWKRLHTLTQFSVLPQLWRAILSVSIMAIALLIMSHLNFSLLLRFSAAVIVYIGMLLLCREPLLAQMRTAIKSRKPS